MTVKLLMDWPDSRDGKQYVAGNLLTTDAGTETGLVDAKMATTTLTGGTAYVAPVVQPQYHPVMASANLTGKIRNVQVASADLPLFAKPRSHFVDPGPGALIGSASALADSAIQLVASPARYSAVRIHYLHAGGVGATIGTKMLVAATDDAGSRDFSDVSAAAFKKAATPKQAGTAYNAVQTDGSPGWRQATWAGVASKAMPDAGSGKISVTSTDLIQAEGIADSNGLFPLLVRAYNGTGPYTRVPALAGQQVAANYASDVQAAYCLSIGRSGDSVTTPAGWSDANSTYAVGGLPIIVEFLSAEDVATVMFVGDSRFAVSAELAATKQYLSAEALFTNAAKAAGKKISLLGCGISGGASWDFEPQAIAMLDAGIRPDVAFYLAWSVNDNSAGSGVPTTALAAIAKFRMLEFVSRCGDYGIRPVILTAFPRAGGFTVGELSILADVKALALSMTSSVIDPLSLYGAADGSWKSGFAFDSNHMTQAGYADLVARLLEKL